MTSDLSKITSGLGPSAARLQLLIERALELYAGVAAMSCAEQHVALQELTELLPEIAHASRETADGIESHAAVAAGELSRRCNGTTSQA
ncbi:hypothetical protein [Paraburkholderia dioscoreae]|uniref:Uncharacterized protein n=1 Tax=Paraburkholderia dioscoreae TaxID=2604047 RepID=A0A5Q4ZQJ2_9BURK|nr:hypothetical protein [Paraburkholderia dioscoreae]VVD30880.1 conserved protein of unknown function [Paraburkholderia dioscoreae]